MVYAILALGILFIVLRFILTVKNARYLLSGYNTMSEEERAKVDIGSYVPFFRKFHLFLGLSLIAIGLSLNYFAGENAAGIFLTAYPILAYIYFIIAGSKFNMGIAGSSMKWGNTSVYVLIAVLLFVGILLGVGFMENKMILNEDGSLRIKGMYSETLQASDISGVKLVKSLPKITYKTNGFALGSINKGYFKTNEGEVVKLILNASNPPYILLTKTDGKKVYYSLKEGSNANLYEKIKKHLPAIVH